MGRSVLKYSLWARKILRKCPSPPIKNLPKHSRRTEPMMGDYNECHGTLVYSMNASARPFSGKGTFKSMPPGNRSMIACKSARRLGFKMIM